ncbi:Fatty acid-binding protein, epidermal [Aphelenchoides fujianensis]|nr:Fatty acid-binding protein, epidermal [Aphelenchoides fujianensis]
MMATDEHRRLIGRWKLESSENFDAYMKEIGIGSVKRKIATATKPIAMLKKEQWTFTPGQRFIAKTVDGRKFWTTVRLDDGGKATEIQENIDDDQSVCSEIVRFVDEEDKLNVVCKANGVEALRKYTRLSN